MTALATALWTPLILELWFFVRLGLEFRRKS